MVIVEGTRIRGKRDADVIIVNSKRTSTKMKKETEAPRRYRLLRKSRQKLLYYSPNRRRQEEGCCSQPRRYRLLWKSSQELLNYSPTRRRLEDLLSFIFPVLDIFCLARCCSVNKAWMRLLQASEAWQACGDLRSYRQFQDVSVSETVLSEQRWQGVLCLVRRRAKLSFLHIKIGHEEMGLFLGILQHIDATSLTSLDFCMSQRFAFCVTPVASSPSPRHRLLETTRRLGAFSHVGVAFSQVSLVKAALSRCSGLRHLSLRLGTPYERGRDRPGLPRWTLELLTRAVLPHLRSFEGLLCDNVCDEVVPRSSSAVGESFMINTEDMRPVRLNDLFETVSVQRLQVASGSLFHMSGNLANSFLEELVLSGKITITTTLHFECPRLRRIVLEPPSICSCKGSILLGQISLNDYFKMLGFELSSDSFVESGPAWLDRRLAWERSRSQLV
eukprot:TRINITY_DN18538_c0_g1_i1.p1 TRINITY_DN18538_c0_g1~~TRINITY_DN18538_c0_g1_i1.p1  ORF type:complete len:480 (-),score=39.73 TRINITY_DN18538_c0_g1_i1:36-1370(-)